MDSNKKKTDELLNFDLIQDENIIIDNIKNFDLDAHFDSELNLDFELDFGLDLESNSKTTKSKKQNRKLNQNKKLIGIGEEEFDIGNVSVKSITKFKRLLTDSALSSLSE